MSKFRIRVFPIALSIAFLVVAVAACGDDDGGTNDTVDGSVDGDITQHDAAPGIDADVTLCEGVDCSGQGTCFVIAGSASCDCESGYHSEGVTCVVNSVDCGEAAVLCVDDTAGPDQEFATLQEAADVVAPGEVVLVFDGSYAGFDLSTSGTASDRVVVRALGTGAVIDTDGPSGYGVWLRNVSYVTIEGLRIVGMSGRGVAHREASPTDPSVGLIIRGNTVQDAGAEGMYLSEVADSLIEGNVISNSGTSGADRTHGIYLANAGSDGTILRGNHIWGSGTAGIHFNGDLSIGGDGIISGLVVEENILHDNGQNGLNMDGVQDSLVQNNLIYGNVSNGLRAYAIDGAEGPRGLVIVNNTFHVPAGAGWCVRITEDLGGSVVFNNILMNDGNNGSIALDDTAGFASANNAVVDTFTPDRDDSYLSLSEWQGLGYDAGSFVTTPSALFTNAAAGDYTLLSNAPALDTGLTTFTSQSAPTTDLTGAPRDATPDIGSYEGS
jgi:parallel beta-helix repeat protein